MEYRIIYDITKEEDKKRVTGWQGPSELDWLEKQKKRIQEKNKRCEIVKRFNSEGIKQYALFYIDGHYEHVYKNLSSEFIKTT